MSVLVESTYMQSMNSRRYTVLIGTSWIPIIRSLGAIKGEGLGNDFNADIGGVVRNLEIPAWVDLISMRERAKTSEERTRYINDFGLESSMFPRCAYSACKSTFKSLKKMEVFIYRQPFIVKILLIFAQSCKPMQCLPITRQSHFLTFTDKPMIGVGLF